MDASELKGKTVAELRELAAGIEGITGYSSMRKGKLIEAITQHEGPAQEKRAEAAAPAPAKKAQRSAASAITGTDKASLKQRIHLLKQDRDSALSEQDHVQLKRVRRRIHRLKRRIRRTTA